MQRCEGIKNEKNKDKKMRGIIIKCKNKAETKEARICHNEMTYG